MSCVNTTLVLITALAVSPRPLSASECGPTYGPTEVHSVYSGPLAVALGDMDDDGDLDAVVASYTTHRIQVHWNNGDGTYERGPSRSCNFARTVAIGDLDGDGDLDVATNSGNGICIFFDDENNVLGVEQHYPFQAGGQTPPPKDLEIGDIDGDGDLDLATANPVFLLMNEGERSFEDPRYEGGAAKAIELGDIDHDGDLDLVQLSFSSPAGLLHKHVSVRRNDAGQLAPPVTYITELHGADEHLLELGDVDGDTFPDIVVGDDSGVYLLTNTGDGAFTHTTTLSLRLEYISLADADGDTDLDLVTNSRDPDWSFLLLTNAGDGTFDEGPLLQPIGYMPVLGDVDQDGDADIVALQPHDLTVTRNLCRDPCASDLDGDGTVGFQDLMLLLGDWGLCPSCPADLHGAGDAMVGMDDLIVLLGAWGSCD